jgi:hypothetical protein
MVHHHAKSLDRDRLHAYLQEEGKECSSRPASPYSTKLANLCYKEERSRDHHHRLEATQATGLCLCKPLNKNKRSTATYSDLLRDRAIPPVQETQEVMTLIFY